MTRIVILFFIISLYSLSVAGEDACVWYGECGSVDSKKKNCPANETAREISEINLEADLILRRRCPHFYKETGDIFFLLIEILFDNNVDLYSDKPKTCCDGDQILSMHNSMTMAEGIFGRCSSCLKNMFRSICEFTCSPDQKKFMKATVLGINDKNEEYIDGIEVKKI